jgi:hypothetical protein
MPFHAISQALVSRSTAAMQPATFVLALLLSSSAPIDTDAATDQAERRARLMEATRLVAVMDIDSPAADFVDDGDPDTLEVVFLSRRSDGPSRVSPDGQVVFLYTASRKLQSELIDQAFDRRARPVAGGD